LRPVKSPAIIYCWILSETRRATGTLWRRCGQASCPAASATRALGCRFSPAVARALLGHPGPGRRAFSGKGYTAGRRRRAERGPSAARYATSHASRLGRHRGTKRAGRHRQDSGWERQRPSGAAPGSPPLCRNQAGAGSVLAHRVQPRHAARDLRRSGPTSPRFERGSPETLDQDAALGGAPAPKTDDRQLNLGVLKP
jgi:hypothetical protein